MGPERHFDEGQRRAETKVSHMDICVGEKEHSLQREQWGQGFWDGVHLEFLGRARRSVCLEQ